MLVDADVLPGADPVSLGLAEDVDDDVADAEEEAEDDAEDEAEEDADEAAVDAATCVAGGVVQVGSGVGPGGSGGSGLVLLGLGLGLSDGVSVAVEVPLRLGLGLGLELTLELALELAEVLGLGLEVLWMLWLPLDDVAGAVVVSVVVPGELELVWLAVGCVDGDVHEVGVVCPNTPGAVGPVPSAAGVGTGLLPLPSVAPGLLEGGVLMLRAEPMALPIVTIAWRAGGTTDRTTPIVNTATPTAKAGRSIASRQSLGRCGARRGSPRPLTPPRERPAWSRPRERPAGSPPRAGTMRRTRSASRRTRPITAPEKASQTPSIPLGCRA